MPINPDNTLLEIPNDTRDRLKKIAIAQGRSMKEVLRRFVEEEEKRL